MAYEKFDPQSLLELDGGRIREAMCQALARCEADMHDRPGVKGARKLTLEITFKPVMGEDGDLDGADVTCQVKESIPRRSSRAYAMRADKRGGLFFNEHAPENPNQRTLDEGIADPRQEVTHAG